MRNELPGDPNLPPGVTNKDIDGPEMETCKQCNTEVFEVDSDGFCEDCAEQNKKTEAVSECFDLISCEANKGYDDCFRDVSKEVLQRRVQDILYACAQITDML